MVDSRKEVRRVGGVNLKHEEFSVRLGDIKAAWALYEMARGAHDPLLPFLLPPSPSL